MLNAVFQIIQQEGRNYRRNLEQMSFCTNSTTPAASNTTPGYFFAISHAKEYQSNSSDDVVFSAQIEQSLNNISLNL